MEEKEKRELLFSTSFMGHKVEVYPSHMLYRQRWFGKQILIPMNQIASVTTGMPGIQRIIVETSGGKKLKVIVRLRDKEKLCNMISGEMV
jgi:hypothetical protein